jgi:hypothetical protein
MCEPRKSPIPQGVSAVFYISFIAFVLVCLAGSGLYCRLAQDLYSKQRQELKKLQERVSYNESFNIQQNFSLTEIEKRLDKLEETNGLQS